MNIQQIKAVYFIGAGGIGMSALVRYFLSRGFQVGGYDRTSTVLTQALEKEGAKLHYMDDVKQIEHTFLNPDDTLIVITPAIPADHTELNYFRNNGFTLMKRAQVLGMLTRSSRGLCVAGTHGKTTTSSMLAHLLHQSHVGCTAFLGGISQNYGTNLLLSDESPYTVIEADEFDRSFHWLTPYMSVITSTDPDHLDIYGTREAYLESFEHYSSLITPGGVLLLHTGLPITPRTPEDVRILTYGLESGDFHAEQIKTGNGSIQFDFCGPDVRIPQIDLGVPVRINIENAVAAIALAWMNGVTPEEIRSGMASFSGVERRFDFKIRTPEYAFLSDYAHHPEEIKNSILSIKDLYRDRKVTVIFQPHLYTRTRDLYPDFARSLSLADELILLDIYPAREQPIEGVSSRLIYDHLRADQPKQLCTKGELLDVLREKELEVVMVLGAGDIDNLCPAIEELLHTKFSV